MTINEKVAVVVAMLMWRANVSHISIAEKTVHFKPQRLICRIENKHDGQYKKTDRLATQKFKNIVGYHFVFLSN